MALRSLMGRLWGFGKGKRQAEAEEPLYERLRRLESDVRALELEWQETYGKLRSVLGKIAKREKRFEESEGEQPDLIANGHDVMGAPMSPAEIFRRNNQRRRG